MISLKAKAARSLKAYNQTITDNTGSQKSNAAFTKYEENKKALDEYEAKKKADQQVRDLSCTHHSHEVN